MKAERMAILSMLEKGIITAHEAERLLIAIKNTNGKDTLNAEEIGAGINNALNKAGDALGVFVKTVGEKVEDAAKEMEPMIKKVADTVAEKADNVAEDFKNYTEKLKKEREKEDYIYDEYNSDEDQKKNESNYNTMVAEVKEIVKQAGDSISPEEYKRIAFGEKGGCGKTETCCGKENENCEKEETCCAGETICEKEKTCCGKDKDLCPRPTPCCWEQEQIDWEDVWKDVPEKQEEENK